MKRFATAIFVLSFVVPSLAAAGTPPFEATLQSIQDNVFSPRCAQSFCHGAATSANLDLRDGQSFSFLVDVTSLEVPPQKRVEPFAPDDSYLICKLENCPSIVGQQMPIIGGFLLQEEIDVIRDWILMGAPEFPTISVDGANWGRVKAMYR